MARKVSIDRTIADVEQIIRAWTESPEFKLGDLTLEKLQKELDELRARDARTETLRTQLAASSDETMEQAIAVRSLHTRVLSGFRAFFGPDSIQYGAAGGTRQSDRKRPARKTKKE